MRKMLQVSKWLFSILGVFIFATQSYAITVDKIVVLGDSLSDNGNLFSLTSKAHKVIPMVPLIPKTPPYRDGHFSNGKVWVEHVAEEMNIPLVDYAYGGSWVEPWWVTSKLKFPYNMGLQVDAYLLANIFDLHKANHLFILWSGANDYLDGRPDADAAVASVISHLKDNIDTLISYKARYFVLPNLPDISLTPELKKRGPDAMAAASHIIALHNAKLAELIAAEKADHPEVVFITINIDGYFKDVVANPEKYNLKNVTEPCYNGSYYLNGRLLSGNAELDAAKTMNIDIANNTSLRIAYMNGKAAENNQGMVCLQPEEYLFWDQIHPTHIAHVTMSKLAIDALNANDIHGKG